ncbi:MAG TPA: ABC transporter permease [Vicinamibacterales bacterium]|nr:ABC transporter permease [Vicinamibacterales bacterium]
MSFLDLRHAVRVLAKNLGVTSLVVFTLALAIGATTAIFSVVWGVLLRPLPFPDPDRLMAVWEVNHRGTYSRLADPNFDDLRDRNRTFAAMAKYTAYVTSVAGGSEPTRTTLGVVTGDFFKVLGVSPAIGRGFTADDLHVGAAPAVIVSHQYWTRYLGASAALPSLALTIESRSYAVVGVMPAGFQFPASVDLWVPAELDRENRSRTSHNFWGIGRLREGVSVAQADADVSAIAKDIVRRSDEQGDYLLTDAAAVPLQTSLTGRVGSTLYVLLGAVFFLLLVACANVTNLLLSQAAARGRELAIRHALGARRGRLIRQFVAEASILLALGCSAGLVVAALGLDALLAIAPADLPRLEDVSLSWPVMAFAMALSAVVAVGLGLVTAIRATRRDPRETLTDGSRGQAGASSQRVGRAIVAAQLAITVVLLIGAALLGRSLLRVLSVDPGFRTDGIVAMDLGLPDSDDPAVKAKLPVFYADLFDRLQAIPGVAEVAAANAVPLDGGLPDGLFVVLAPQEAPAKMSDMMPFFQQKDRLGTADYCAVSPAYFRALGIPLIRGRLFDDRDQANQPHVAVISESLARGRWPGEDPIGRTIEFGNMDGDLRLLTIVGIVGDTHEYGLEKPALPTMYVDLMQRPRFTTTVVLRTGADPGGVIAAARGVLHQLAPQVPPRFRTFEQIYAASLGARRFNLTLVGVFAGTALILAVAGIYGVMAYNVSRRRREIGVRIALGATAGDVLRIVLVQGLATIGVGVVAGVLGAIGLTRGLQSLLFGVTPTDPLTFGAVVGALAFVGAIACYVPARRGTRVNPVEALRQE